MHFPRSKNIFYVTSLCVFSRPGVEGEQLGGSVGRGGPGEDACFKEQQENLQSTQPREYPSVSGPDSALDPE
jgi:hypothetical protein